jgi:hypothetical protein
VDTRYWIQKPRIIIRGDSTNISYADETLETSSYPWLVFKEIAVSNRFGPINRIALRRGFPLGHNSGARSAQTQIFQKALATEMKTPTLFSVTSYFFVLLTQFFLYSITYVDPG